MNQFSITMVNHLTKGSNLQFSIKKIVLLEFNLNKMAHLIHFNIHSPSKKRINCNHSNSAAVALVKFQPEEQGKI